VSVQTGVQLNRDERSSNLQLRSLVYHRAQHGRTGCLRGDIDQSASTFTACPCRLRFPFISFFSHKGDCSLFMANNDGTVELASELDYRLKRMLPAFTASTTIMTVS
jgi:ferredoxin-thioredoxin reductase catalytic subunit